MKLRNAYLAIVCVFLALSSNGQPVVKQVKLYKRYHVQTHNFPVIISLHDVVYLTHYTKGTMTISDFYEIANGYVDTVKTEMKVFKVEFLDVETAAELSSLPSNRSVLKHAIIGFSFVYESSSKRKLVSIVVTENGKKSEIENPKQMDTLLASKTVLN